ncbi:hypothetical protein NPX13_g5847 [Xylaria arbuscula]|uniref:Uncharacterized protein n=1 Tax=Xylaria arbuscula TaxID=114810 RepID=A0A9W8TMR2_9PEZI|nr:hypothetical protein NPX13_g5847 [Xylaria arbuscula]
MVVTFSDKVVDHTMPLGLWAQPLWNPERALGLENGQRGITCLGNTKQGRRCCKPISATRLEMVSLKFRFLSHLDPNPVRVRAELHELLPSLLCHLHGTQKEQVSVTWDSILDKIWETMPAHQLDQNQSTESSRQSTKPLTAWQQHGSLQTPSSPRRAAQRELPSNQQLLATMEELAAKHRRKESSLNDALDQAYRREKDVQRRLRLATEELERLQQQNDVLTAQGKDMSARLAESEAASGKLRRRLAEEKTPALAVRSLQCPSPSPSVEEESRHPPGSDSASDEEKLVESIATDDEEDRAVQPLTSGSVSAMDVYLGQCRSFETYQAKWKVLDAHPDTRLSQNAIPWPVSSGQMRDVYESNVKVFIRGMLEAVPDKDQEAFSERERKRWSQEAIGHRLRDTRMSRGLRQALRDVERGIAV